MEIAWRNALLEAGEEIMIKGGRLEFIVYKRDNRRKPVILKYPQNEINCKEEILTE